jgi:hypothetical protein
MKTFSLSHESTPALNRARLELFFTLFVRSEKRTRRRRVMRQRRGLQA